MSIRNAAVWLNAVVAGRTKYYNIYRERKREISWLQGEIGNHKESNRIPINLFITFGRKIIYVERCFYIF